MRAKRSFVVLAHDPNLGQRARLNKFPMSLLSFATVNIARPKGVYLEYRAPFVAGFSDVYGELCRSAIRSFELADFEQRRHTG